MSTRRMVSNMNWIIAGRVVQMILGFFVSAFSARYLGPANLGTINYTASFVSILSTAADLGISSYLMKELIDHKDREGEVLGSAMLLHILSSILAIVTLNVVLLITDGTDPMIHAVAFLQGINILFATGNMLSYWYQIQLRSKTTSIITLIGYFGMTIFKIFILVQQKDIRYFAFTGSLETALIIIMLFALYKRDGGPKLRISKEMCKDILKHSYHFILADMMSIIYTQTDKIMLKQMLDETATGFYSVAFNLIKMWPFILMAIIQSFSPLIMEAKNQDEQIYRRRIRQCYASVFWVGVTGALLITLLAPWVIHTLYGLKYEASIAPLRVLSWNTVFCYLGVARGAWLVSEGLQKYQKYLTGSGAVVNILINWLLIPSLGAVGAAAATVATQFTVNVIMPLVIKDLRPNMILVYEAIIWRDVVTRETLKSLIQSVLRRFRRK